MMTACIRKSTIVLSHVGRFTTYAINIRDKNNTFFQRVFYIYIEKITSLEFQTNCEETKFQVIVYKKKFTLYLRSKL